MWLLILTDILYILLFIYLFIFAMKYWAFFENSLRDFLIK